VTIPRFWRENPARYNFIGSRCPNCNRTFFPARSICPVCHRKSLGKMVPLKLKGEGAVHSFTEVHEGHEDFEMQKPYIIALIDLDEGVRVTGQLIDCEPDQVSIGMRVRATLRKLGEDGAAGVIHYGYKFRPMS